MKRNTTGTATTTAAPRIIRADIRRETACGSVIYTVSPVWSGVDRNDGGWSTGSSEALAKRLAAAMESGKAFGPAEICVDIHGKTFVSALANFRGRVMSADLKKIGF